MRRDPDTRPLTPRLTLQIDFGGSTTVALPAILGGIVARAPCVSRAAEAIDMAMPATTPPPERWTRAMFDALPDDGQRHEIIDGVHYVNPSPGGLHQLVVGELHVVLHAFLKREPLGWVLLAPFDVDLGNDTVVEPDIVVVPRSGQRPPRAGAPGIVPILAIEVISPSSGSRDRILKRRRYQRARIGEYWIVDPLSRLVERWRPEDERPEIITESLHWLPAGASSEMVIDLASIFADVAADPE
jgi:Uma2 family endonuclease